MSNNDKLKCVKVIYFLSIKNDIIFKIKNQIYS